MRPILQKAQVSNGVSGQGEPGGTQEGWSQRVPPTPRRRKRPENIGPEKGTEHRAQYIIGQQPLYDKCVGSPPQNDRRYLGRADPVPGSGRSPSHNDPDPALCGQCSRYNLNEVGIGWWWGGVLWNLEG